VHSGPFGCLTKLGATRAELVQKIVPRSRAGIFCNERTRSTPLDSKLTVWCVSYNLGAFGTVWLPYKTRRKTSRTSAIVRATKSRRNFSQRKHPIHPIGPKLMFWCISYYLGAFGTVWLPYETRCKTGGTSAKVRAQSHVIIFHNERTRSTPLYPKLTFWFVSSYLGALGNVWSAYETRCKTRGTSAKVRATESLRNFSQRTHPIHPIGP